MAAKKTVKKKKSKWGGPREGAGRPLGSGHGPSPDSRRNRIAVMLDDKQLKQLKRIARKAKRPVATVAYKMIEAKLKRAA